MQIGAVICELNPFHNGHRYLFDMMKNDGCDCIIAVMSSSFTQRGDVAIYSKFERTGNALKGGADIVIELPVVWAVASAQRFARGACEIIKALGCVDKVYFGCESNSAQLIKNASKATCDPKVNKRVKELMKSGAYYPSALSTALRELYSPKIADIIESPNNILAVEYTKELSGSGIDTVTVERVGAEHDSNEPTDNFASASLIRKMITDGEDHSRFIPDFPEVPDNPASYKFAERAFLYKLRSISPDTLKIIPDVSEGLENRIIEASRDENSIESILNKVKTKRYTHARLRRIFTCALLGITADLQNSPVPYIRILGFKERSSDLLRRIKASAKLPVIINVAQDIKELDGTQRIIMQTEMRATDIRTVFEKSPTKCSQDLTNGIIKI